MALVPFYEGDGSDPVDLEVAWISEFARGTDGLCAFCDGDPCAERSHPETRIARYFQRNRRWAETCPLCGGRPS